MRLSNYEKYKEHLKRVAKIYKPKSSDSKHKSIGSSYLTLSQVQTTINISLTNAETLKAEIIWALYCVKICYSNNSLNELNNTFSTSSLIAI